MFKTVKVFALLGAGLFFCEAYPAVHLTVTPTLGGSYSSYLMAVDGAAALPSVLQQTKQWRLGSNPRAGWQALCGALLPLLKYSILFDANKQLAGGFS